MFNSKLSSTLFSILHKTKSGFKISKPEINFCRSPAVIFSCILTDTETLSFSTLSICLFNRTCLRFKIISVTSSTTPGIVVNSCSMLSILTDVIANPSNEANNTLLRALPIVRP